MSSMTYSYHTSDRIIHVCNKTCIMEHVLLISVS